MLRIMGLRPSRSNSITVQQGAQTKYHTVEGDTVRPMSLNKCGENGVSYSGNQGPHTLPAVTVFLYCDNTHTQLFNYPSLLKSFVVFMMVFANVRAKAGGVLDDLLADARSLRKS